MEPQLTHSKGKIWCWRNWETSWNCEGSGNSSNPAIVLIHGFGACKEHWRHNQTALGNIRTCYAIDLLGFGGSSQPKARLRGDKPEAGDFLYGLDNWGSQIADFCNEVVKKPVILIGNSIGGVIALRASQILKDSCCSVVLIDCAQRTMDDKRLSTQQNWMKWFRPILKKLVSQRWLSNNLFRNAANKTVIRQVLMKAYPSGANIDEYLVNLLHTPSQRLGAKEAFRGFINLFDDHLAPDLMKDLQTPVDMIWGEKDPWEPLEEAQHWLRSCKCTRSLEIISGAGHCPHDEAPEEVNPILLKLIQQAT